MLKTLSLCLCLSACAATAAATPKEGSRKQKPGPVEREFGAAERAAERRAKERAKERREQRRSAAAAAARLPPPTPATTLPASAAAAASFKQERLPPFTVTYQKPDAYKRPHSDPNRATDPSKVRARDERCRGGGCQHKRLMDEFRFPVKTGAIVYDALRRPLGRLAPAVRLQVGGRKQLVPQQIQINKNEGQMLRLRSGKTEKFEMARGVQLTNGQHVSGLVRRTDIPPGHRPRPYRPKREPAPGGPTVPFYITGGGPSVTRGGLTGVMPGTGERVPLKFGDQSNPPRGYALPHREGNDYLPRPLSKDRSNGSRYVNVLGNKLPGGGRGGVARTVVRVDRNDPTPPVFDVLVRRDPQTRKLYLPGRTDPVSSLTFLPGRLRGAGKELGRVYIAVPNLSPLPAPVRRH